jgi:UDPglucose 6-dehydrogenase
MAKKIGIIGIGVVGSAVQSVIPGAFLYDKYKNIGSAKDVNQADIVFICVNTPYLKDKGFDLSAVDDAISILEGEKIVVIKSTALPGSTDKMQAKYPQHKLLFNPEFLRQASAVADMADPGEQIVGYTEKSKPFAQEVIDVLPKAPQVFIVAAKEAEMIKYFSNAFLALKVTFANQIYDICQKAGINYERVKEMASASPRFAFSHFDVMGDGYRGYSGACLPKDVKALIQFGDEVGAPLDLLKSADAVNKKLLLSNKDMPEPLLKLYQ